MTPSPLPVALVSRTLIDTYIRFGLVALLAVLLKLYTNVSSLRNELSAPEKNVTRNKCTSLLSLVIPLVMQGSAVSTYYSSCFTQYGDDDDVDHPVFETTSPGVAIDVATSRASSRTRSWTRSSSARSCP